MDGWVNASAHQPTSPPDRRILRTHLALSIGRERAFAVRLAVWLTLSVDEMPWLTLSVRHPVWLALSVDDAPRLALAVDVPVDSDVPRRALAVYDAPFAVYDAPFAVHGVRPLPVDLVAGRRCRLTRRQEVVPLAVAYAIALLGWEGCVSA